MVIGMRLFIILGSLPLDASIIDFETFTSRTKSFENILLRIWPNRPTRSPLSIRMDFELLGQEGWMSKKLTFSRRGNKFTQTTLFYPNGRKYIPKSWLSYSQNLKCSNPLNGNWKKREGVAL